MTLRDDESDPDGGGRVHAIPSERVWNVAENEVAVRYEITARRAS